MSRSRWAATVVVWAWSASLTACDAPTSPAAAHEPAAPPTSAERPPPPRARKVAEGMGRTYDEEVATLRRRYATQLARTKKVKGFSPWIAAGTTALAIARLTGDYTDYAEAEKTIERSFAASPPGGGFFLRAKFNYQMHRLDRIEADLPTARAMAQIGSPGRAAALVAFEGKVAMQSGRLDHAQQYWANANKMSDGAADLPLALWAFKTGDFASAEQAYAKQARNYHGREAEGAAWLDLMQAIMDLDRGRYDEALAHLDDADADLSGYWLVDEHRAEITALQGDTARAMTMYRDIIARTNNPEFMDALASLLRDEGRVDEAQQWINRATGRYADQMALYPEASYGHALGHFLDFGPPERALALARKNHDVRPNPEAKMHLASAQLAMGNVKAAKAMIEAATATPWNTADLHYTAYEIYTAAKLRDEAATALAKAKAINPRIDEG